MNVTSTQLVSVKNLGGGFGRLESTMGLNIQFTNMREKQSNECTLNIILSSTNNETRINFCILISVRKSVLSKKLHYRMIAIELEQTVKPLFNLVVIAGHNLTEKRQAITVVANLVCHLCHICFY